MAQIEITNKMRLRAKIMEAQILEKFKEDKNYTGISIDDRFYIGYLGELAFQKLLHDANKQYSYVPTTDGKAGGADFVVIAHRELEIEIKTTAHPNAEHILIPQKQFELYIYDIYIGVQIIEDKIARICGWCFHHDLIFDGSFQTPCYKIKFTKLYPIEKLIERLQQRPQQFAS